LFAAPRVPFHRVVLSQSEVADAHRRHVAKQFGLFMVGKYESVAQRFKETEEAKWTQRRKKEKKNADTKDEGAPSVTSDGVPFIPEGPEKRERRKKLLERMRTLPPEQVLHTEIAEELFALTVEGEDTHSRVGMTGLNHHYFAEDHATFMHKGQVYDGVFGKAEEEGSARQVQAKLRGMLVAQKLLPDLQSGLWDTEDVSKWDAWAVHETDLPAPPRKGWDNLDSDQLADVLAGVVADGWAPGSRSLEESEKEWARRAAVTQKIQKTRKTTRQLPIEWISKTYVEPKWTHDDAKRRWRERKVALKVRLDALELPGEVRTRLELVLGERCKNGWAKVVADRYDTKEENRMYSLLLLRALLTDAFEACPRFVRVGETKKGLIEQHDAALRAAVASRAEEDRQVLFSFRFQ
jgi:hypothetical protein